MQVDVDVIPPDGAPPADAPPPMMDAMGAPAPGPEDEGPAPTDDMLPGQAPLGTTRDIGAIGADGPEADGPEDLVGGARSTRHAASAIPDWVCMSSACALPPRVMQTALVHLHRPAC